MSHFMFTFQVFVYFLDNIQLVSKMYPLMDEKQFKDLAQVWSFTCIFSRTKKNRQLVTRQLVTRQARHDE